MGTVVTQCDWFRGTSFVPFRVVNGEDGVELRHRRCTGWGAIREEGDMADLHLEKFADAEEAVMPHET
jgi:hypothetical protein